MVDRRVARTRAALFDALVRLVRRRDYDLITVQDILDEADVGRATFYAHFTSKDDLLRGSLGRLRELLLAAQGSGGRAPFERQASWSPSRTLFEHVREFADVRFSLAGGRGGAILRDAINEVLAGVLRLSMPARAGDGLPRELAILHIVSTIDTTLRWWLEHHPELSAAEADATFRSLLFEGVPEASCDFFVQPPPAPSQA
jgi:AcrR family transcriptional regulator